MNVAEFGAKLQDIAHAGFAEYEVGFFLHSHDQLTQLSDPLLTVHTEEQTVDIVSHKLSEVQ